MGTSLNEISWRCGGTGWSGMAAKFRQLGWVWVEPTPFAQLSAAGGRSVRRTVEPRNTIRTVPVWPGGAGFECSPQPTIARVRAAPAVRIVLPGRGARVGPAMSLDYGSF